MIRLLWDCFSAYGLFMVSRQHEEIGSLGIRKEAVNMAGGLNIPRERRMEAYCEYFP